MYFFYETIGLNYLSSLSFVRFYSSNKKKTVINKHFEPSIIYLNSLACKNVILKDNRGKAGIYK
jgi:hypothetical protein